MRFEVLADADAVARKAAEMIAAEARESVESRGRFVLAVSGGRTPWQMLQDLADQDVPWERVYLVQVDERVAPAGDPERNLTHLRDSLLVRVSLRPEQICPMPVEAGNLAAASEQYGRSLERLAGSPSVIDLIHLGLGSDGHTASLVPGDPVLEVSDRDVAITGFYQGHRRMTLTYPILNRARRILWVVTGAEKAGPLAQLQAGNASIPAGRVLPSRAIVLADRPASICCDAIS